MCDKGRSVGLAGLAWGRKEAGELVGVADDGPVVHGYAEEAFEEVGEGGEVVHPGLPELLIDKLAGCSEKGKGAGSFGEDGGKR